MSWGPGGYSDIKIRAPDHQEVILSYLTGHCIIGTTGCEHDQWLLALHGQLICKVSTEGQTCNEVNVISHVQGGFIPSGRGIGGRSPTLASGKVLPNTSVLKAMASVSLYVYLFFPLCTT